MCKTASLDQHWYSLHLMVKRRYKWIISALLFMTLLVITMHFITSSPGALLHSVQRVEENNVNEDTGTPQRWSPGIQNSAKLKEIAEITEHIRFTLDATRHQDFSNTSDLQRIIRHELEVLDQKLGIREWKLATAEKLRRKIFSTLDILQNPRNCSATRKLHCFIQKGCGFGCGVQDLLWCGFNAYIQRKMLVVMVHQWDYAQRGWDYFFQPLSRTCPYSVNKTTDKIFWDSWGNRTLLTQLPSDIEQDIRVLGSNPLAWWYGQLLGYYLRPSNGLEADIRRRIQALNYNGTVVGIHVRRTDKIGTEGALHSVDEYMTQAERYFKTVDLKATAPNERKVYVATDDPNVIKECLERYLPYKFLYHPQTAFQSGNLSTRYRYESIKEAIMDIFLLAKADFLVGTFSSGFTRLAYELMQYYKEGALENVYSLDVEFHYVGALNAHRTTIYNHTGLHPKDLTLRTGDVMIQPYIHSFQDDSIHGKIRDGYSWGKNHRTGLTGNYPLYKTKSVFSVVNVTKYD